MGNILCCRKKKVRRKIVLLLLGLDNAGKTKTARGLAGDLISAPVPTVGFSTVDLEYHNYNVKIFDLGGGPHIRGIWNRYFVDAYGVIFVIDSSDHKRLNEVKTVLEEILSDDKIAGKPLLVLANKQDHENALDEVDLIEYLQIEDLVNMRKCPTLVQSCSANDQESNKIDKGIQKGYEWLVGTVIRNYVTLQKRVEKDVQEQAKKDHAEFIEKLDRIKNMKLVGNTDSLEIIETYSDYLRKMNEAEEVEKTDEERCERVAFNDARSLMEESESSGSSSMSFPPLYLNQDYVSTERPKSAVQLVKHQLALNGTVKKPALKPRSNRTAPLNLYGVEKPHSAQERRTEFSLNSRSLKSADDRIFTVCNNLPNSVGGMGPSGDYCTYSSHVTNTVKPDQSKKPAYSNGVPWNHEDGDHSLRVIDVE